MEKKTKKKINTVSVHQALLKTNIRNLTVTLRDVTIGLTPPPPHSVTLLLHDPQTTVKQEAEAEFSASQI